MTMPPPAAADAPTSMVDLLDAALREHADRVLLVDPVLERTVTYAEFARLVEGAAAQMVREGMMPG